MAYDPSLQRRTHRQRQQVETVQLELERDRHKLDQECAIICRAHMKINRLSAEQEVWADDNPDIAFPEANEILQHSCFAVLIISSWLISLWFLFSPAQYLIGQNLGEDNPLVGVGIVVLTLVMISSQVAVSIQFYQAKKEGDNLRVWHIGTFIMSSLTSLCLVATFLAKHVGLGRFPWPHELLLLAFLISLSFFFDSLIVYNGKYVTPAATFFLFGIQSLRRQRQIEQMEQACRTQMVEARHLHHLYERKLAVYNNKHPQAPLTTPPFNDTTLLGS